jgi:hypothetical protein
MQIGWWTEEAGQEGYEEQEADKNDQGRPWIFRLGYCRTLRVLRLRLV